MTVVLIFASDSSRSFSFGCSGLGNHRAVDVDVVEHGKPN